MHRLVGIPLVALTGCLLQNPAYGDEESATGGASGSGATASASTGGAPPTTGATDGSAGSASASGTGDATTGGPTTTGEVSAGTGSTGQADTGSSTGEPEPPPVTCPGEEIVLTLTRDQGFPARDAFVVSTPDAQCQWKNSDGNVLNSNYPCAQQNYGGVNARYTVIGALNGGRAEYLVAFGLFDALEAQGIDQDTVAVASARLRLVAWWAMDRGPISFRVGAIADSDVWVEGDKGPDLAADGDSSWEYRWIENQNAKHPWTNPAGPAAGSEMVTTVEVPALTAAEFADHPYFESGEIAGKYLQPWLSDPAAERGFVISTEEAPILVKSKDTGFDPQLVLTLCPQR